MYLWSLTSTDTIPGIVALRYKLSINQYTAICIYAVTGNVQCNFPHHKAKSIGMCLCVWGEGEGEGCTYAYSFRECLTRSSQLKCTLFVYIPNSIEPPEYLLHVMSLSERTKQRQNKKKKNSGHKLSAWSWPVCIIGANNCNSNTINTLLRIAYMVVASVSNLICSFYTFLL